jgi:hypothetical protein
VLDAGRQILAFIAVTAAVIVVVDAVSRTPVFAMFDYPGGAVLVYGLSMSLIWLIRQVAPFALPPGYYRPRPFESHGRLFRRLGVERFKWLLFKSRVELLNVSARLSHGRSGLRGLDRGIRAAETDHTIALLIMVVITIYAVTNAWWALAGWLLLANIVANVYPIMVQRHNRARLLPVLERLGSQNRR